MIEFLLGIIIGCMAYQISKWWITQNKFQRISHYFLEKNDKYYQNLLNRYEKNKKIKLKSKLNIFYQLNILLEKIGIKQNLFWNPFVILIACGLSFFITYHVAYSFFRIWLLAVIIAIPFVFLPIWLLNFWITQKEEKIEKVLLNFLLQLKNHTRISNDIIYAFKEVQIVEPLQGYIKKFLLEVHSGVPFEKAMETFKEKINIQRFRMVLSNLQHCYLYGGNYVTLLQKSYDMIYRIQKEKNRRVQETKNARIVLYILIFLDLFVYVSFIKKDYENYRIMTHEIFGLIILYWNFISIWFLCYLSKRVKKLDY